MSCCTYSSCTFWRELEALQDVVCLNEMWYLFICFGMYKTSTYTTSTSTTICSRIWREGRNTSYVRSPAIIDILDVDQFSDTAFDPIDHELWMSFIFEILLSIHTCNCDLHFHIIRFEHLEQELTSVKNITHVNWNYRVISKFIRLLSLHLISPDVVLQMQTFVSEHWVVEVSSPLK